MTWEVCCGEIPVVFSSLVDGTENQILSEVFARLDLAVASNSGRARGYFGRIHCDRTPSQIRGGVDRMLRSLGSGKGMGENVSDPQMLQTAVQIVETQTLLRERASC